MYQISTPDMQDLRRGGKVYRKKRVKLKKKEVHSKAGDVQMSCTRSDDIRKKTTLISR